jgi:hypothetical protein
MFTSHWPVSHALRRLSFTHKSVVYEAMECNELLRNTWWAVCVEIPKECFVWLDGSSIDNVANQ